MAVSGSNVYVAGGFVGTAAFGSVQLTSRGNEDGFVAKLTDGGTSAGWVWGIALGGTAGDQAYAMVARGANVYVGGVFDSPTATIGPAVLPNASANGFTADGWIACLADTGPAVNLAWAQGVGGTGSDFVTSLAVAGSAVIVGGQFSNTVAFGNTVLMGGSNSGFVAKLLVTGSAAQYAWAVQMGGFAIVNAVAVAGTNVYVAGRFIFMASFGSTSFTSMGTRGGYDVFLAKITDAGTAAAFTWAVQAGGTASDYANAIAASSGNVYVVGGFSESSGFGSTTLTGVGIADNIFLAKVTDGGSTGRFAWATSAGGVYEQQAASVAIGTGGRVYMGGGVVPAAAFGAIVIPGGGSGRLGFLASMYDVALTTTASALLPLVGSLFPNPAHGRATVQLPAVPGTATATLTILDALGRTLRTQTAFPSARAELDLTGLAPGLYAVRVTAGAATATQRLVVE